MEMQMPKPETIVIFLRTPYNYDRDAASNETGIDCKDPSLAQQQFKDDSDLNVLFNRYLETNEMPQVDDALTYGNFEGIFDFQTAMNAVVKGRETFQQLPHRIKTRFDNDPQKLLQFLADPDNFDESVKLGLRERKLNETGTTGSTQAPTQSREGNSGTPNDPPTPTGTKTA